MSVAVLCITFFTKIRPALFGYVTSYIGINASRLLHRLHPFGYNLSFNTMNADVEQNSLLFR